MGEQRGEGWPPWVETWVMPYLEDSALWPVAFALLGHVVVVIVPVMLLVWRGSVPAVAPLLLLLSGSAYLLHMEFRAKRRPGVLSVAVLLTWGSSVPLAYVAETTGVF